MVVVMKTVDTVWNGCVNVSDTKKFGSESLCLVL